MPTVPSTRSLRVSPLLTALCSVWLLGCQGGEATGFAGNVEDTSVRPVDRWMPSEIEPPALPDLGRCRPGWTATEEGGQLHCIPWESAPDCGYYERATAEGCVRVGTECPVGDFPDDVAPGAIYVLSGAEGGDGSRDRPYGTTLEVMRALTDGAEVVLGAGSYNVLAVRSSGVTVRGVCPERVSVQYFIAGALDVEVRNLSVVDDFGPALFTNPGENSLRAEDLVIDVPQGTAVASSTSLQLTNSRIHAPEGSMMTLAADALLRAEGVHLSQGATFTVMAGLAGSTLELIDPVVLGGSTGGDLAVAVNGATFIMEGGIAELPGRVAMTTGDGDRVVVRDSYLRGGNVAPGEYGLMGSGLFELERVVLDNIAQSLATPFDGGRLVGEDVWFRGTPELPFEQRGLEVVGSEVQLRRARFSDLPGIATLVARGEGTFQDITVDVPATGTRGIHIQQASTLEIERVEITGASGAGLIVGSAGTTVDATDVVIVGTREAACDGSSVCGRGGIGVGAYLGSSMRIERFALGSGALAGAQTGQGSQLTLVDGAISDNPVGLSFLDSDFEIRDAIERVVFVNNGVNADFSDMPPPPVELPTN